MIFVPKVIKVGFQSRTDTYTGQLSYVIYVDEKGVLRKEKSWETWRSKEIPVIEHENEPTSGFVLNKKVGGYKSHFDMRQTYVRVYDPRGFEFEITVPNLLYILENADCIKGKGLDGEFVYGWDGTELVLVPVSAADYQDMLAYRDTMFGATHIRGKDLIVGATYLNKWNEELVYMGRFPYFEETYYGSKYNVVKKGNRYCFFSKKDADSKWNRFDWKASLGSVIIKCVNPDPDENYASYYETLESSLHFSPYDSSKDLVVNYTLDEFTLAWSKAYRDMVFYGENGTCYQVMNRRLDELEVAVWRGYNSYGYYGGYSTLNVIPNKYSDIADVFRAYHPRYILEHQANGKVIGRKVPSRYEYR